MEVDFMAHVEPLISEGQPFINRGNKIEPLTVLGAAPIRQEEPSVFDLEIAKSKMNGASVNELVEKSESFSVGSAQEAEQGLSLAMQSRKLYNSIENTRKEIVRPHLDFQRSIKAYADGFSSALKKMERNLLGKVEGFQKEQEREAARLHAIKVKKEEEERRKIEEANKKAEVKIPVPTVPTPAPYIPPPQKIAVEDGISRTEQVWKFDINDASIIPREYLIIDERAIKHSIKAGIRSIPGVKIYSEQVKKYRVK